MPGNTAAPVTILAIDDDPSSLDLVAAILEQDGVEMLTSADPRAALDLIARRRPHIVISDLMMPGITGMDILTRTMAIDPATEVILLTAHYSTEAAVEAIRKGASDYVNKPVDTRQLRDRIDGIIGRIRQRMAARRLDRELIAAHQFGGIVGRSPLMLDVFARLERIAPHYRSVLITGATGSGKEVVSRALHKASPVSAGPFVVCNTAAIPDTLVESELFGHVKGAFTGATQDKAGLFEAAHGGTILLDEIGDMPLSAQAKLLRVVQQHEVQRVGSASVRKVSVRIIAATHRDLRAMVADRTFREDLFFRLAMVELNLPPLRERKEDLPLLVRHFLDRFNDLYGKCFEGFTRKAEAALGAYEWPGNVRELEGVIGSAMMMADPPVIDVSDLPAHIIDRHGSTNSSGVTNADLALSLDEIQSVHARRVVDHVGGDKIKAAHILGVSRATLYRLLSKAPDQRQSN